MVTDAAPMRRATRSQTDRGMCGCCGLDVAVQLSRRDQLRRHPRPGTDLLHLERPRGRLVTRLEDLVSGEVIDRYGNRKMATRGLYVELPLHVRCCTTNANQPRNNHGGR